MAFPVACMGGTIPACTGEPRSGPGRSAAGTDYPRVYGGTTQWHSGTNTVQGLSPRVRGNRAGPHEAVPAGRTIPACTGEPDPDECEYGPPWDYPRVYGGTTWHFDPAGTRTGLSPRVRGNHLHLDAIPVGLGTIPACTGEPFPQDCKRWGYGDYPRVYGGTRHGDTRRGAGQGLSPRVRGNPPRSVRASNAGGTIPACTGEPPTRHRPG